ncbi:cAMP-dependent protein kinase regulatory subunit Cgs1 [Dionaea muscipula]
METSKISSMAVNYARVSPSFQCRPDPDFHGHSRSEIPRASRFAGRIKAVPTHGPLFGSSCLSSLILRFPPNFVRQLSTKARRNCSNIGVAQIVAASWSNNDGSAVASGDVLPEAIAATDAATITALEPIELSSVVDDDVADVAASNINGVVKLSSANPSSLGLPFLSSDGSIAVHGGERLGRAIVTDSITTPVVNTSAYFFKNSDELIDFKEKRHQSYEYARYGNPTTAPLERKISALEGAESTLFMASGMCASTVMLLALVPAGGHIITTTDCYRKTRIFVEGFLPKMGIKATVIDPADIEGLKSALAVNNVTLFFSESPTNPFLRCVDIQLVSELCHRKGALVCIDGTFATPLNQKALALGADIVLHSATKYIAGHNDVLGGCLSGREDLIAEIRNMHHIIGGTLNPNAAYLINRGLKTLHIRMREQNSTALRIAELLESHPKVKRVYYPGLPSHPEHELAKRQMSGFGGVVSFEVDGDLNTTKNFVDALEIPYIAPSFGGCESIVDQPAIMSYWDLSQAERLTYGIKDNLVRFSFGLEDFKDLQADILQALESI